jgi:hypothetical protein
MKTLCILLLLAGAARADEPWWHDPARGCGLAEEWKSLPRMKNLPGCDGELPRGAPPGEVAMHDAKGLFVGAERILDAEGTAGAAEKIEAAIEIMNKAPSDPRVNWARVRFSKAVNLLRGRILLVPRLAALRAALKGARVACDAEFQAAADAGVDLDAVLELLPGKMRSLTDARTDCAAR